MHRLRAASVVMDYPQEIRTSSLLLRRWKESDRAPFAAMHLDPRVIEYLSDPLSREETDAIVDRIQKHFAERSFGFWAVEIPGVTDFAGFVGLSVPRFTAHFTPAVEIGWRLASGYWGAGYATEAAEAALAFGFEQLSLEEIVAFTVPATGIVATDAFG
jgi:RimJ/RimL family protein N-acetyltransferase